MKLFYNPDLTSRNSKNKFIFIDNDVLGELFRNQELFNIFSSIFDTQFIIMDLVQFEFLRDIYDSKSLDLRQQFIKQPTFTKFQTDLFLNAFPFLLDNSLLLAQVYKHEKYQGKSSPVDLLLAAILMLLSNQSVLITSNKKDFPGCVFDTLNIINMEKDDGQIRNICLLSFNKTNFEQCLQKIADENQHKE